MDEEDDPMMGARLAEKVDYDTLGRVSRRAQIEAVGKNSKVRWLKVAILRFWACAISLCLWHIGFE